MNWATQISSGTDGNPWPSLVVSLIVSGAIVIASIIIGWQVLKHLEL
jgi:hypothetical protein